MRKRIFGRRLKRDKNARRALFRNLMRDLIIHERIKTTEAKAKAIRGEIEKLVTRAKKKGETASRDIRKTLIHPEIVDKLINNIAPRFANRPGGYTRIVKLGDRVNDAAPAVFIEWVERVAVAEVIEPKRKKAEKTEKVEAKKEVKTEKVKKEDKKAKKESKKK